MRARSVLVLVGFSTALLGCASPCARVETAHAGITTRSEPVAAGDHIRLSIPMKLIDTVVAREVRELPTPRLPLPEVAGVQLGTVGLRIDRIQVLPTAPEQVAFSIAVSLRSGPRLWLPLVVRAEVRPRLETERARVVIALDEQGLVDLDAKLGQGGTRALIDAVWAQLPGPARLLTSKKQLAGLARSLADTLLKDATELVKRELLDDLGRVARVELDLPTVPVDRIRVRSTEQDVIVGFHTPLPSRGALPEAQPRTTPPPHQVELALHASTAAELVNDAMGRGEVPSRFDLGGTADPRGALHAHLDWASSASKPLLIHTFLLDPKAAGRPKKDCAHVTLGATPKVTATGGHIVVSADDAKVEEIQGSLAVKAGLFFGGVGRRSFEHVETVATQTEFELGAQTLRARVEGARLQGSNLVLGLSLAPVRAGR